MKIQVRKMKTKEGVWGVHFECTEVNDVLAFVVDLDAIPTVCMSRTGSACSTPITSLQDHNDHAPGFVFEQPLDEYIQRIRDNVEGIVEGLKSPNPKPELKAPKPELKVAIAPTTATSDVWTWYTSMA